MDADKIMFLCILCFLATTVLCSGLYWLVVGISERARAFDDYITLRIRHGGIKKARFRKEKERKVYEKTKRKNTKRAITIDKYNDAYAVVSSVCESYSKDKNTVDVIINNTSFKYVMKILRKEGLKSYRVSSKLGTLAQIRIEL